MVRKTDGPETVYRKILAIEPRRGGETGTADVLRWLGNWMNLKLSAEVVAAAADDTRPLPQIANFWGRWANEDAIQFLKSFLDRHRTRRKPGRAGE